MKTFILGMLVMYIIGCLVYFNDDITCKGPGWYKPLGVMFYGFPFKIINFIIIKFLKIIIIPTILFIKKYLTNKN